MTTDVRGTSQARSATPQPLLDVQWLDQHLSDRSTVVVEVGADAAAYHQGHVPGATALSWLDDLNEQDRRGVPSKRRVERLLGGLGISRHTHVVLYGEQDNVYAAYAYWTLRYYGHRHLSLLDGGRRAWIDGPCPLSAEATLRPATEYVADEPDETIRLTRDEVLERYVGGSGNRSVLDCRNESEYRGRPESAIEVPVMRHRLGGHIPGARNIAAMDLLEPSTGRFLPQADLRAAFEAQGIGPERDLALYCDVGGRAALGWFVLHELLGFPSVRLYEGGWSEYGSLVGAPVSR